MTATVIAFVKANAIPGRPVIAAAATIDRELTSPKGALSDCRRE